MKTYLQQKYTKKVLVNEGTGLSLENVKALAEKQSA